LPVRLDIDLTVAYISKLHKAATGLYRLAKRNTDQLRTDEEILFKDEHTFEISDSV
jgi:hypothetical protein